MDHEGSLAHVPASQELWPETLLQQKSSHRIQQEPPEPCFALARCPHSEHLIHNVKSPCLLRGPTQHLAQSRRRKHPLTAVPSLFCAVTTDPGPALGGGLGCTHIPSSSLVNPQAHSPTCCFLALACPSFPWFLSFCHPLSGFWSPTPAPSPLLLKRP